MTKLEKLGGVVLALLVTGACADAVAPTRETTPTGTDDEPLTSTATESQKLTASDGEVGNLFGEAVAVDDGVLVVGARGDDEHGDAAGAAYVFEGSGATWTEVAKLTADEPAEGHVFGHAVAVDGDVAVVGELLGHPDNDSEYGAAYVFERSGGAWTRVARLSAREGTIGDLGFFGDAVAVSGDRIVVGAWGDDENGSLAGAAYVFERSNGTWTQVAKLTASDGAFEDFFGESVAVDGDLVAIGAPVDDDRGDASGAAYVFEGSGGGWTEVAKLTASDGSAMDNFGFELTVSGDVVVVGARFDQSSGSQTGAAYVFERSGGSWSEEAKLTASDAASGDRFGEQVALRGGVAVIGANEAGTLGLPGSAYVFEAGGGTWSELVKLVASDGRPNDRFGESVAVDDGVAFVGAVGDHDQAIRPGVVYLFDLPSP